MVLIITGRSPKVWPPLIMKGEWRLLFRASRDGFAALKFHSKCDNKGPTITVVKCGENIFGGFTEKAWTSKINWYDSKVQIGFNELVTTDEWLRTCLFNFKACRKACVTVILALITFVNFLLIFKLLFPLYSESLHTPHTCAICVR